jgi:hypothetical protein
VSFFALTVLEKTHPLTEHQKTNRLVGGEAVWEYNLASSGPLIGVPRNHRELKEWIFQKSLTRETKFVEYWSELYGKEDPEHLRKQKGKVVER